MSDKPFLELIESKLAELRKEWAARPDKRKVIELQAKALLRAKQILMAKREEERVSTDLYEQAKEIFKS